MSTIKEKQQDHKYYMKARHPKTKIGQLEQQLEEKAIELEILKLNYNDLLCLSTSIADETLTRIHKQVKIEKEKIYKLVEDEIKKYSGWKICDALTETILNNIKVGLLKWEK